MRLIFAVVLAGCSSSHPGEPEPDAAPECEDADGDGYGEGGDCRGPDCDDGDASRFDACRQPECAPDERRACPGMEGVDGVGICRAGEQRCSFGAWAECTGRVTGQPETCNDVDDDCDGEVDDGVLSTCGDCDATCHMACAGIDCPAPIAAGPGAEPRAGGAAQMAGEGVDLARHVIWLAARDAGRLYQVDTTSLEVVGAYRVGADEAEALPFAVTADPRGNAIVLVQGDEHGLVRIDASECPDADSDGVVTTSTGQDDVLDWGTDECVRWTSYDRGTWPFAAGFGPDGALWASFSDPDDGLIEVNPETGGLGDFGAPDVGALAIVGDQDGLWLGLWSGFAHVGPDGRDLERLDEELGARHLDFDGLGRPLVNTGEGGFGWFDEADGSVHDIDDDTWRYAVDGGGRTWTLPLAPNGQGGYLDLFEIRRWDDALVAVEILPLASGAQHIVGDLDGGMWTTSRHEGTASVYDTDSGEHRATFFEGCDDRGCLGINELYGDPAGLKLHRLLPGLIERAETAATLDVACPDGETASGHVVTADLDDDADAVVEIRGAATREALVLAPWTRLAAGDGARAPMVVPLGALSQPRFVDVRVRLRGEGGLVRRISVGWHCGA